tara:strand:- start:5932 stop:6693 length:762 start_codon:yes stop_codon:yes gene_type:complete
MDNLQRTKDHYKKYNPSYFQSYGLVLQSYMTKNVPEMLAFMAAKMNLKNGDSVLDAGSGFGGPAFYFSKLFDLNILGINIDPKQVMFSTKFAKKNNMSNITFKLHDFHELYSLSKENAFDKIYFLESIGHCNDLLSVFNECSKVVNKDGLVFIKTMFSKPSLADEQPNAVKDVGSFYGYTVYDESYFKKAVAKSKFIIDEISEFPNMDLNLNRVGVFESMVKDDTPGDMVSNNCKLGWKNFSMKYIILKKGKN